MSWRAVAFCLRKAATDLAKLHAAGTKINLPPRKMCFIRSLF